MANPLDQSISKGAGLAPEVRARMDGLVGVFEALVEQHGEAGALLERAKGNSAKRAELWPTIRASLRAHEKGELAEVYPIFREYAELVPLADRHEKEASELSATLDAMDAMDPAGGPFGARLDKLIGLVEAHVAEEEHAIFPQAQAVMGKARAKELEPKFAATAKKIKQADLEPTRHEARRSEPLSRTR